MTLLPRAARWLVLLAAVTAPAAAGARDFECEDACSLYEQRCLDVLPAKQQACRVACTVGGETACRARCRLAARDERRGCHRLTQRCKGRCAAASGPAVCLDACAGDARTCLQEQIRAAPVCVDGCGGPRADVVTCRFRCYRSWQRGMKKCLRAAPTCVAAARGAFNACRAACGTAGDAAACADACRQTFRDARRACFAQPESGLFACVSTCAASSAGASRATGHEGRQAD